MNDLAMNGGSSSIKFGRTPARDTVQALRR
jgi:hypothetical protein